MRSATAQHGSQNEATKGRRAWQYALQAVRLAIILGCVWMGWSTFAAVRRLFRAPVTETVPPVTDVASQMPLENPFSDAATVDGFWTFAGWDWELARAEVTARDLEQRLERAADGSVPGQDAVSADARRVMDVVRRLATRKVDRGGRRVYCLDSDNQKLRIVVCRRDENEVVVGGALAAPVADGGWSMFELRRRVNGQSEKDDDHLLPLPLAAERMCARTGAEGHILLEVIRLPLPAAGLWEQWNAAGWSIHHLQEREAGELSCICARNEEGVHAWAPSTGKWSGLLVLRRLNEVTQ